MSFPEVRIEGGMFVERHQSGLEKREGMLIWRLYFRGGPTYTKAYPEWLDKADVFKRASELGDLIDVEEVK